MLAYFTWLCSRPADQARSISDVVLYVACSKGHLIALDIVRGLVFLHSNKVVHADLKAKNVLLTQNAGKLQTRRKSMPYPRLFAQPRKHILHLMDIHFMVNIPIYSHSCFFTLVFLMRVVSMLIVLFSF